MGLQKFYVFFLLFLGYLCDIGIVDSDRNTLWHLCIEKHLIGMFDLLMFKAEDRIDVSKSEFDHTVGWVMGQRNNLRRRELTILQCFSIQTCLLAPKVGYDKSL